MLHIAHIIKALRSNLSIKFLLPTVVIVVLGMAVFGVVMEHVLVAEIEARAQSEAVREIDQVLHNLDIADELGSQSVHTAMNTFLAEAKRAGSPHIAGSTRLCGQEIPNLLLGGASQVENFDVVDRVKRQTGATATLFVRSGNDFIRVSTNVSQPDHSRAIGTALDRRGQPYTAISNGNAFYGVTNILGRPYMTGYEPMLGKRGDVVGAWYVGYPLDSLFALGTQIKTTKILDNGFVGVAAPNGAIVFKSDRASDHEIQESLVNAYRKNVLSKHFDKWNYTVVAMYPQSDVDRRVHPIIVLSVICAALVCWVLIASNYMIIDKLVLTPVKKLLVRMQDLVPSSLTANGVWETHTGCDARDEINLLVSGFDRMVIAIQTRDQQLRCHSEKLEQQLAHGTAELATAHDEIKSVLECIPSILIGLNSAGLITLWNQSASNIFGITADEARGKSLASCGIEWHRTDMAEEISTWLKASAMRCDDVGFVKKGELRFVGFSIRPILSKENKIGYIVTGADITERKGLEEQLRQAHKLEAVGQLAAGIAHEINTPTQYVTDNSTFLKESWTPILSVLECSHRIRQEAESGRASDKTIREFDKLVEEADISYLKSEIPKAIDQSLEGLQRISKIVGAMKEFSHPGSREKVAVDINRAIETTVTVARNEWKYVAELEMDFDTSLPPVPCLEGEFNQVILNLIVNAGQAISAVTGDRPNEKGKITISTRHDEGSVKISIHDTGAGIPYGIQSRIFEPFFTTKPVGKGTGQGLAIAHTTIVKLHQGQIWFESAPGCGTTFFIRLPLEA